MASYRLNPSLIRCLSLFQFAQIKRFSLGTFRLKILLITIVIFIILVTLVLLVKELVSVAVFTIAVPSIDGLKGRDNLEKVSMQIELLGYTRLQLVCLDTAS